MPIPNLLHPVPISIQQLDKSETIYDHDFRSPVQQETTEVTKIVSGQVSWTTDEKFRSNPGGPQEGSDGYVLFRLVDLTAAGVIVKREDRLIRLGTVDVDVYVTGLRYMGHYPDVGGPTLVKAYFADRQPARQTRGT